MRKRACLDLDQHHPCHIHIFFLLALKHRLPRTARVDAFGAHCYVWNRYAMFNFERFGLSQKLTIISVLSTGSALMLVFIAFAGTSVLSHTEDERQQLASLAA